MIFIHHLKWPLFAGSQFKIRIGDQEADLGVIAITSYSISLVIEGVEGLMTLTRSEFLDRYAKSIVEIQGREIR